nr:zinc finger, CCHC-type [Tanacetum cinerariifolium]
MLYDGCGNLAHTAWIKGSKEIDGLKLMTMEPEIQQNMENLHAHEMLQELKTLFSQQAEQELLQTTQDFHSCKQEEGQSVSYLRKEFDGFVQNYNMHSMGKTITEFHAMVKLHEQTLPKNNAPALYAIRADPEEELHDDTPAETLSAKDKGKGILVEDPKPMKKKDKIEMDAEYARKLQEEEESHVQAKDVQAKGIQYIRRYHGYKKKPQFEYEARKNMIAYLKNTEGFKMAFFKGKTYDQILKIFQPRFDANMRFLLKSREEMEKEKEEIIKSINETPVQKAAKRRRLREQAKEDENLKKQLEVVVDEDDDVFVEATPIGRKVTVVNYKIVMINNKPMYKIFRIDDTHQLYTSFITLLKNFYREDLEDLWKIVKARFSTSKPTNFTDDYLLVTLKNMFEKADAQDVIWRSQQTEYGQALIKKSFWDYALETTSRILNMVLTKKVEKTPYKVWHGQAPKFSYLKVWGYEALVKRDTLTKPDKLEPRYIKRELKVSCYTDAGYLTDADDLKSQTRYMFVLNGGAVDWKSTKQSIFATSSAEAKYIAAFDASK